MKTVVVYESMYGNTHVVAKAIGEGLGSANDVVVVSVADASNELLDDADLVVVGGPTHAHGMSRPVTRKGAAEAAAKPDSALSLDSDTQGAGVREWLASLNPLEASAAAFDTRMKGAAVFTGQASKGIARLLSKHGLRLVDEPRSFLVTKDNQLLPGEEDRARQWGEWLAGNVVPIFTAADRRN